MPCHIEPGVGAVAKKHEGGFVQRFAEGPLLAVTLPTLVPGPEAVADSACTLLSRSLETFPVAKGVFKMMRRFAR